MSKKINLVLGQGEVGKPLRELLSTSIPTVGYDLDEKLCIGKVNPADEVEIMHVCYGFQDTEKFIGSIVSHEDRFCPSMIVIHSTVKPYTTAEVQERVEVPVVYSPVRGIHSRMKFDMQRYEKFWACYPRYMTEGLENAFEQTFLGAGIKTRLMSSPHLLEYSKILVDTSYYGWLITYAQITDRICKRENLDYDELWEFADEIQEHVGNRPKMFPGIIGGHCVIPNAKIIDDPDINLILTHNEAYTKLLEKRSGKAQ